MPWTQQERNCILVERSGIKALVISWKRCVPFSEPGDQSYSPKSFHPTKSSLIILSCRNVSDTIQSIVVTVPSVRNSGVSQPSFYVIILIILYSC
ncbi:hypothetical protein XENTR_v10008370 [Xenopus tropicalis]|nr:hypothetical protein XENTR_v10008370 [Xenopus tropicalis]